MKMLRALFLGLGLAMSHAGAADIAIRQSPVHLDSHGAAAITGRVKGRETVDYVVRAQASQVLTVVFKSSQPSAYFNVLHPGSEEALFVGSVSGERFEASLPAAGEYRIRVYLMRNAARRNATARYSLKTSLGAASAPALFDRSLELQGIRFHVRSTREGTINTLRIEPSGLEIDNSPMERTIDGAITGAEVADLNADGSPEIYVYVATTDGRARGSLVAYAANRRKSLSEIHLPSVEDDTRAAAGYRGHDEFAVLEGVLGRRFPIHDGTGGSMRQIQYKLVSGEAGWLLKVDKVIQF